MSKPIDQERALFEAHWAKYVGVPIEHVKSWRKGESYSGRYAACVIAWESWQARAQLPTAGGAVPKMPATQDRRPYDDDDPDGYLEGNHDWAENNNDAVEWLADNHVAIRLALAAAPHPVSGEPFQARVLPWLRECFGQAIADDKNERNHRFLEEALELVQSCGCTEDEAHKLVAYVYGRAIGERSQEVGGVMVTLAALCLAQRLDMHQCGEVELARILQPAMVEKIREKQKRKPAMSPLPGAYGDREQFAVPPAAQDVSGLLDVATGKIQHARNGMCPDHVEGFEVSDPECPACRVIAAHRLPALHPV